MDVGERVALSHPKLMGATGTIEQRLEAYLLNEETGQRTPSRYLYLVKLDRKKWCWHHWRRCTQGVQVDDRHIVRSR